MSTDPSTSRVDDSDDPDATGVLSPDGDRAASRDDEIGRADGDELEGAVDAAPTGRRRRRRSEAGVPERGARGPWLQPARRPGHRVTRVVRRVQLWSVFKIALLGSLVFYAIFLVSVAVGWSLANSTGQVHHVEKFMRDIGFDNWSFKGPVLFKGSVLLGAVVTVALSSFITLSAAIMNLISELTGGIRVTVIEVDPLDDPELDFDDLPPAAT